MATTRVVGSGPIDFMDEVTGQQLSIPLQDLGFTNNKIDASGWPLYNKHKATVDSLLNYLVMTGALTAAASAPAQAALVLKAKNAGACGNGIQVVFSNVGADPNNPDNFDVTLTETNTWQGLTKDTIESVAGTAAGGCLVYVTKNSSKGKPKNATYPLGGGPPYKVDVLQQDGVTVAFTLNARLPNDAGAQYTTVVIANAGAGNDPNFDLTATWKRVLAGVKVGDLAADLGYEVDVSGPGGNPATKPGNGTVLLRGGAEAAAATPATADVPGPS